MKNIIVRLAVFGVILAACGGGGAVVATVNGAEITTADVESLYTEGIGAVPAEQFAENLRNTIVEFIVIQEAESRFGITITPEEIEERVAELRTQIEAQSGGLSYEEFLEEQGFTEDRIYRIAHQQLVADAVEQALLADEGPITAEELEDRYDAALFDLTEACVSHILVETEDEALEAKARIEAGESFADVAMEIGTDGTAQSGGELGCSRLSQYVPEFALGAYEVPLNETSDPVRSQFGYHLILVTERTTTPLEEAEAQLRAAAEIERAGRLVQDWLLGVVSAADVTIDEKYGTWVTEPFPTVQPPS
ncbi:MAG: peptidylprolyl isomerase [Acidimicrobiia bacterium]|nr:peptidylprolyl isomerase [Acidimicrobiia bacterium]